MCGPLSETSVASIAADSDSAVNVLAAISQPAIAQTPAYQVLMDSWERAVAMHGLEFAVAESFVVAPLSYYSGERPIKANSRRSCGSFEEVFGKSACVVNYWQTSKHGARLPAKARHRGWRRAACGRSCSLTLMPAFPLAQKQPSPAARGYQPSSRRWEFLKASGRESCGASRSHSASRSRASSRAARPRPKTSRTPGLVHT